MKKKTVPVGASIILSGIMAVQACESCAQSHVPSTANNQQNSGMSTDSVKLEKRLIELSKTKYSGELSMGAMCYKIAIEQNVSYSCPTCSRLTEGVYSSWQLGTIQQMKTIVDQIAAKDYDVVLDEREFCQHCSKQVIQTPELVFKIRFSDNADYHTIKSNIVNDYKCLLQFVLGNDKYSGSHGDEYALHDNIHIIQKMTGLGKDLTVE